MTGIGFQVDTVTRLRASAATSRYGDSVRDWSTPDEIDIERCRVKPAGGSEDTVDRDGQIRRLLLFAPPTADILATDRIRWREVDYEVTGPVRHWPSPTGRLAHLEIDLEIVEG